MVSREFWIKHWESLIVLGKGNFFQKIEKCLLTFLSFSYGVVVRFRNRAYDQKIFSIQRVSVPVISIGSLAVGGTGKTPLVIWAVEKILKKNKRPVVLSRGYMRQSSQNEIKIFSNENEFLEDPLLMGDEPTLIAQKCKGVPIIVGSKRDKTAQIACERFKPDCLFLDDGFQHRALHRDLEIVCLSDQIWKAPQLFPRGFLREGFESLSRADFIVIKTKNKEKQLASFLENYRSYLSKSPDAIFFYGVTAIRKNDHSKTLLPSEWLSGKRVISCCGIADPESFEDLLKEQGAKIQSSRRFSDHHLYTDNELDHLLSESIKNNCIIVTTEKDQVKMRKDFPAVALSIGIQWQMGEKNLEEAIFKMVGAESCS